MGSLWWSHLFTMFLLSTLSQNSALACHCKPTPATPLTPMKMNELPLLKFPGSTTGQQAKIIDDQITALKHQEIGSSIISAGAGKAHPVAGVISSTALNSLFTFVNSTRQLERQMTDLKIDSALIKTSIQILKSRLSALKDRVNDFQNPLSSDSDKATNAQIALNSCSEIFNLFQNHDYVFFKSPVVSFPYLKNFARIFATVGQLLVSIRPYKQENLETIFQQVRTTLKEYGNLAWAERVDLVVRVKEKNCMFMFYYRQHHQYKQSCHFTLRPLSTAAADVNNNDRLSRCAKPDKDKSQGQPYDRDFSSFATKDEVSGDTLCGDEPCAEDYLDKLRDDYLLLLNETLSALHLPSVQGSGVPAKTDSCLFNWVKAPRRREDTWTNRELNYWNEQYAAIRPVNVENNDFCRLEIDGHLIAGRRDHRDCQISYNGRVHEKTLKMKDWATRFADTVESRSSSYGGYEVLANIFDNDMGRLRWVASPKAGEPVPVNAVVGGYFLIGDQPNKEDRQREPIYVSRCIGKDVGYFRNGKTHFVHTVSRSIKVAGRHGVKSHSYTTTENVAGSCDTASSQILVCDV